MNRGSAIPKTEGWRVERELYLPAPPGRAVYAQNPAYTRARGFEQVESVKEEALHFDARGRRVYYHPRLFRRFSADNGRTWTDGPDQAREEPGTLRGRRRNVSLHALDARRDALIALHCTYEVDPDQEMFATGNRRRRTYRPWYELSFDGGRSWSPLKPVVDERPGYDEIHWGPGLDVGRRGASTDLSAPVWLDDGRVLFGLTLTHAPMPGADERDADRPGRNGVIYLSGRWNAAGTDLLWRLGAPVLLDPALSPVGCCEPAPAALGGGRLFNVMRCQGDAARALPSTRYATYSDDAGDSWSAPEPLRYDDGGPVWTPASLSSFFRSSRTGRWYWLANILPGPVCGQTPRYPLALAEFDPDRRRIIRASVRTIQDRPAGRPREVRYTNWGALEDRESGELILTLPDQPRDMDFSAMTRPEDFTADCLRYRIRRPDGAPA